MKITISLSLNLLVCTWPAVLGRSSSLDWSSQGRVDEARCRASCGASPSSSSSSQESCWAACDSPVGGRFSLTNRVEDVVRSRRSQVWELSQPLTVTGCEVRWGQLEVSRNSYRTTATNTGDLTVGPGVGLLLGRDVSGEWREISEVSEEEVGRDLGDNTGVWSVHRQVRLCSLSQLELRNKL